MEDKSSSSLYFPVKLEIRFDSVSTEASESPESFVLFFIYYYYYYYFFSTIKMVIQLKSSFQ